MIRIPAVILIISLVLINLSFSGCSRQPQVITKIVYVHTKCPKLQTFDVNTTKIKPLNLNYKVIK